MTNSTTSTYFIPIIILFALTTQIVYLYKQRNITDNSNISFPFYAVQLSHVFNKSAFCNSNSTSNGVELSSMAFFKQFPHSLKQYITWHSHLLKCMKDSYCTPHVLIWSCPNGDSFACAGLGDRFRGLQFSFFLAIITKRLFLLQWPEKPHPFQDVIIRSSIDWHVPNLLRGYQNWASLNHKQWPFLNFSFRMQPSALGFGSNVTINMETENIEKALSSNRKLSIYTSATLSSVLKISFNDAVRKRLKDLYWKNIDQVHLHRVLLQSLFLPSKSVSSALVNMFEGEIPKNRYPSIHVRTGADFGEDGHVRFHGKFRNHYEIAGRFLKCLSRYDESEEAREVFLATDSLRLKQAFTAEAGKYNKTIITSDVPTVHVGRKWYPKGLPSSSKRMSFLNVYVDLFGLASSNLIIANGSGFSRIAFFLGHSKHLLDAYHEDLNGVCTKS